MMPKRIQMSRQKPWRADNPDAVIVARPSKLGNPFKVAHVYCEAEAGYCWEVRRVGRAAYMHFPTKPEAITEAVEQFRSFAAYSVSPEARALRESLAELRGRDVACWCGPGQPCHGDVVLELANP